MESKNSKRYPRILLTVGWETALLYNTLLGARIQAEETDAALLKSGQHITRTSLSRLRRLSICHVMHNMHNHLVLHVTYDVLPKQ
jgi:hypothetical protein